MALPASVASGARWSRFKSAGHGPFLSSAGNLYVVAEETVSTVSYLYVYKSTDGGNTWTAQDTADSPRLYTVATSNLRTFDAAVVGDAIVVSGASSTVVTLTASFSMATDQWTTPGTISNGWSTGASYIAVNQTNTTYLHHTGVVPTLVAARSEVFDR